MNWDDLYLKMAKQVAQKSRDESTKHGCILVRQADHSVLSVGYNGLPRGMEYKEEFQQRPLKYLVFEHAERNAIYNACRNGINTLNSIAYVTGFCCADCVRALIQSGVKKIIIPGESVVPDRWKKSIIAGINMAHWCEVEYCTYHPKRNLHSGVLYLTQK